MLERFTRKAREAVEGAVVAAQEARADEVRPEHLLAALLEDPAGLACRVLDGLGTSPDAVRAELERHRGRYVDGLDAADAEALQVIGIDLDEVVRRIEDNLGGVPGRTRRRPRFSRPAKKVLELALREAVALRHNYIGTEHLLLALARTDDRVVADTFAGLGISRPAVRDGVVEALRKTG